MPGMNPSTPIRTNRAATAAATAWIRGSGRPGRVRARHVPSLSPPWTQPAARDRTDPPLCDRDGALPQRNDESGMDPATGGRAIVTPAARSAGSPEHNRYDYPSGRDIMTYDLSPDVFHVRAGVDQRRWRRDQARQVGSEAANAGGAVAQTAKEQGQEVVGEAQAARPATSTARPAPRLAAQTSEQQQRGRRRAAFAGRRDALDGAAAAARPARSTELAHQAADRVHGVAGWLEQREPGDLLNEVKTYARRNPGTFLVGAALSSVWLAGRLTNATSPPPVTTGGRAAASARYDPDRTAVIPTRGPCRTPCRRAATSTRRRAATPSRDPGYAAPGATYPDGGDPRRLRRPAGRHRPAAAAGEPDRPAAGRAVERRHPPVSGRSGRREATA